MVPLPAGEEGTSDCKAVQQKNTSQIYISDMDDDSDVAASMINGVASPSRESNSICYLETGKLRIRATLKGKNVQHLNIKIKREMTPMLSPTGCFIFKFVYFYM